MTPADELLLNSLTLAGQWARPSVLTGVAERLCMICGGRFTNYSQHGAEHLQALGPQTVAAVHLLVALLEVGTERPTTERVVDSYRQALKEILGHPIPPERLLRGHARV